MLRKIASSFKLSSASSKIFLTVISAVLLTLSYPKFNIEFLAWFAFIPFFFAICNESKIQACRLGFLFGFTFFAITICWLTHVSFLGYIVIASVLAAFFALFAFFTSHPLAGSCYTGIFFIPLSWILLEYVRAHLFGGFGWALLGYSQYLNLPIIQIADKAGVWGVSFLVMTVNVAGFKLLKEGPRRAIAVILIATALTGLSLFYGYGKLTESIDSKELSVSVIQGNIPQHMKWDAQFREDILARYINLTKKAASENTDLIIWPETALPGYLEEKDLMARITGLAKKVKTPLLIGAPSRWGYENDTFYNSALLVSEKGEILTRHDKMHLVPFGEYVPFEENLVFIRALIDKPIGSFSPGKSYTIFNLKKDIRFGVLICFEDIFPGLVSNFVKKGADFMINITNDAWFMDSSEPYQHAQASVFRAVENRVPVVRAANTGLSCFIDSRGRIVDKVSVNEKDIFVTGFKTSKIHIPIR